jgi:LuxR family maltose regulon positive regulatory protein
MPEQLLTTKLYIPPVHPSQVPRPGLIRRLDESLRPGHKLTLVSAPAGFGKTTLLAAWLAQVDAAVGWLSLDENDNDPARFLRYLGAAFEQAAPRLSVPAPGTPSASLEPALVPLINQLASLNTPLVLVLDDFHLLASGKAAGDAAASQVIDKAIEFLIDRAPPVLHTVIATRADPSLPLPRWRARQQLTEIRADDLRFTQAETTALLQSSLNLTLDAGDLAALDRSAEGWIAALQLATLSLRKQSDPSAFVKALSGSQRYILDYLVSEVLEQQAAEIQRFLVQTSILERLSAPLCDAVLEDPALPAHAMLDRLERANLFLAPLDDERRWYRYHRLFRDFLRAHLEAEQPDRVSVYHRRAAAWYAGAGSTTPGSTDAAIYHALEAQDHGLAASLIGPSYPLYLQRGEVSTLRRWIDALPETVRSDDPVLVLGDVWTRVVSMDLDGVETSLAQLEHLLETKPGLTPEERTELAGEILTLRATCAISTGDVQAAIRYAEQALAQLPAQSGVLRSVAAHNLGNAYSVMGEARRARTAFGQAIAEGRRSGNHFIAFSATFNLGELLRLHGEWSEAEQLYRKGLAWAKAHGARTLGGIARIGLGLIHWDRWELAEARQHLESGIDLAQRTGAQIIEAIAAITLACLVTHQGHPDRARTWSERALAATGRLAYTTAVGYVDWVQAESTMIRGNREALAQWLAQHTPSEGVAPDLAAQIAQQVARARLILGDPGAALDDLIRVRETAVSAGWTSRLVETLALEAQAHVALGERERALAKLARALDLSWEQRFARPFAEQALRPPLIKLADSDLASEQRAFVKSILSRLGISSEPQPARAPLIDPLTGREMDVLRLLPGDLSTAQIADQLVTSYHTVRTHLKHIYGKLDAHSRHEAVTRARDLGLL